MTHRLMSHHTISTHFVIPHNKMRLHFTRLACCFSALQGRKTAAAAAFIRGFFLLFYVAARPGCVRLR